MSIIRGSTVFCPQVIVKRSYKKVDYLEFDYLVREQEEEEVVYSLYIFM